MIDFVVVLMGYAISGEPTLKAYYERLQPFATPFMALFGRQQLPHRSTLSRFLAALDQASVEALRSVFLQDALARLGPEADVGGLWDRQGNRWIVFDLDGTRQAARQRALPQGPDLPPPQRRLSAVCTPGYMGRKRGEVVRTRTTLLQAHTHQWLFTFGGVGNGDYRGELLRGLSVIVTYQTRLRLLPSQALVRLDGLYGNGAIIVDLIAAGVCFVMRGKDYALLDLTQVKERLALPADEQFTHPESGTCRDLFDCGEVPVTRDAHRSRLIVATHQATSSPIGVTRDQCVYELFFTALPAGGFTEALVVKLYLHRGSFETVLADEDREQDSDRWSSYTTQGKARLADPCTVDVESAPRTQPALAAHLDASHRVFPPPELKPCQPRTSRRLDHPLVPRSGRVQREQAAWEGKTFLLNLTAHCVVGKGQRSMREARRPEHDGTVRVLYAARIADCRCCPLRIQCQGHGTSTKKPRRVSAVLHPLPPLALQEQPPAGLSPPSPHPILWGDWSRGPPRRAWIGWQRSHLVTVEAPPVSPLVATPSPLSRAERAHWRMTWQQRLARNARPPGASPVEITVYGLSTAFAQALGLRVAVR